MKTEKKTARRWLNNRTHRRTGNRWFPKLPGDWQYRSLKFLITRNDGGVWGEDFDDSGTIVLRSTDMTAAGQWDLGDPARRSLTPSESRLAKLRAGDLVITKSSGSDLHLGKTALVTVEIEEQGCCFSNFMQRIRPIGAVDPAFLWRLLNSEVGRAQMIFNGSTTTGLANLGATVIGETCVPLPDPAEQRAIAAFLDRETARIDASIGHKERLLALLEEKRQGMISQAVTRGLNPSALSKKCDTDIYPAVPTHWSYTRVRYLCRHVSDGPHFSPKYVTAAEGVMFLSARNVKADRWSLDDAKYVSKEDYIEFSRRIVPEKGDVLYTKGGTTGVARVVDLDFPFQVWVHIAVLKVQREIVNPYFLAYMLNGTACYSQSQLYTRGATNNDLGLTRLINIVLAIPDLNEQLAIVDFLDRMTRDIDAAMESVRLSVAHLQEYRSALITAAVTGQIDVRSEVPSHE